MAARWIAALACRGGGSAGREHQAFRPAFSMPRHKRPRRRRDDAQRGAFHRNRDVDGEFIAAGDELARSVEGSTSTNVPESLEGIEFAAASSGDDRDARGGGKCLPERWPGGYRPP
jgi:hypothetical protein